MTQPMTDGLQYSRMMAEHFGVSILESDARLLHERITMLISEAYTRGAKTEREACAAMVDRYIMETEDMEARGCLASVAHDIRARGQA